MPLPVSFDVLLEQQAWLRRIARDLVRDASAADDLVQETYLAALRNPPHDERALRGWLRRVLRRTAFARRRSDDARTARETAPRPERPAASAADLVARAEVQQRVAAAVLALEEPYRTTVMLRFFEDLPPSAVAERMGVPVETVRTRLRRALVVVRGALERTGDDPGAWRAVLLPWALGADGPPPAPVVSSAAPVGVAGALGGLAMGKWLLALTAVAVLVLAVLHTTGDPPSAKPSSPDTAPIATTTPDAEPPTRRDRRGAHLGNGATAVAPLGPEATDGEEQSEVLPDLRVLGRVTPAHARHRRASGWLVLRPGADEIIRMWSAEEDGSFEVRVHESDFLAVNGTVISRTVVLRATLPGHVPYERTLDVPPPGKDGVRTLHADIELEPARTLTVRVVDASRQPVRGARAAGVMVSDDSAPHPTEVSETDENGVARIRVARHGSARIAVLMAGYVPYWGPSETSSTEGRLPDIVLERGNTLRGRLLVDDDLRPTEVPLDLVPRWRREPTFHVGGAGLALRDGRLFRVPQAVPVQPDGTFELTGVPDPPKYDAYHLRAEPPNGTYATRRRGTLSVDSFDNPIELDARSIRLALHVLCDGEPVANTNVSIDGGGSNVGDTDDAGVLRFRLAHGTTYGLRIFRRSMEPDRHTFTTPETGTDLEDWLHLPRLPERMSMRVRLTGENAERVQQIGIALFPPGDLTAEAQHHLTVLRGDDGRFLADALPSGTFEMVVRPATRSTGGHGHFVPFREVVEIGSTGRLERDVPLELGARLRVRSTDAVGAPVRAEASLRDAADRPVRISFLEPTNDGRWGLAHQNVDGPVGSLLVPVLAPGTYTLTLRAKDRPDVTRVLDVKAGETQLVEIEFAPPRPDDQSRRR